MTTGGRWFLLVAALAVVVLSGCDKSADGVAPPTASSGSTGASASTASIGSGSGDWCAVAERIGTQSGIMRNKHFVSPQQETLDMCGFVYDK